MAGEQSFKGLPFVPTSEQVIYVESSYDKKLNKFIRDNYLWLKDSFLKYGFDFCYLPLLYEEVVNYHAPYLNEEMLHSIVGNPPSLADYVENGETIVPSLVFASNKPITNSEGHITLQSVPIKTKWFASKKQAFIRLAERIQSVEQYLNNCNSEQEDGEQEQEDSIRFSFHDNFDSTYSDPRSHPKDDEVTTRFRIQDTDVADKLFDDQSQQLIEEIKDRINALRNRGVNTMFLHNLIDESEHISRLRITKDYRIFLVDYNNMEIQLSVLPKAVFLLFLHHPEGIRFKELADYYPELLKIYLTLKPIGGRMRQEQSIRDITNPCHNSINEKCARIREAFVRNFDERLAKNYFITGKRGEPKRISLDKSMVIWE